MQWWRQWRWQHRAAPTSGSCAPSARDHPGRFVSQPGKLVLVFKVLVRHQARGSRTAFQFQGRPRRRTRATPRHRRRIIIIMISLAGGCDGRTAQVAPCLSPSACDTEMGLRAGGKIPAWGPVVGVVVASERAATEANEFRQCGPGSRGLVYARADSPHSTSESRQLAPPHIHVHTHAHQSPIASKRGPSIASEVSNWRHKTNRPETPGASHRTKPQS